MRVLRALRALVVGAVPPALRARLRGGRVAWRIVRNGVWDAREFWMYSGAWSDKNSVAACRARLQKAIHCIEKGLSLPEPRDGFGASVLAELVEAASYLEEHGGADDLLEVAGAVIAEYVSFHDGRESSLPQALGHARRLERYADPQADRLGGVCLVRRDALVAPCFPQFEEFVKRRHSLRIFARDAVPRENLRRAIACAMGTPSVCNRQGWRVYIFDTPAEVARALQHQNGNRGFGSEVPVVLLVTAPQSVYVDADERNQGFIDGGLFSMSLIYALHALGLGTCALNMSLSAVQERAARDAGLWRHGERPVMMIAVGHVPEEVRVARSTRMTVMNVITAPAPSKAELQQEDYGYSTT